MDIAQLVFISVGFAASLVSAVFGFGTALLVLAIGSYILPIKEVIPLATVLFAASTITKTLVFGKYIDWKIAGIMAITSLPFAFAGALLMAFVPADTLKQALGLMILLYIVVSNYKPLPAFKIGTLALVFGSAFYGFLSGLLGSGNLVKVIIFREMNISKEAFVGAMAATSVLSNLAKLAAYTKSGLIGSEHAFPIIGLVFAALLATYIGQRALRTMEPVQFKTGQQIILFVSALGLLV